MNCKITKALFSKIVVLNAAVLVLFLSANETNNIRQVFAYLVSGYEARNPDMLKECFSDMSTNQYEAYVNMFKCTRNYKVDLNLTNFIFAQDPRFSRVDAQLTFEYEIFAGTYTTKQKKQKEIGYFLYKAGNKWVIVGTTEKNTDDPFVAVNEKTAGTINKELSKLPEDVRKKLLNDYSIVTEQYRKMSWKREPRAAFYVLSITTEDVSKVEETSMLWKLERYPQSTIEIPIDVLNKMKSGTLYYFNIFAYSVTEETLSGQIMKIKKL